MPKSLKALLQEQIYVAIPGRCLSPAPWIRQPIYSNHDSRDEDHVSRRGGCNSLLCLGLVRRAHSVAKPKMLIPSPAPSAETPDAKPFRV